MRSSLKPARHPLELPELLAVSVLRKDGELRLRRAEGSSSPRYVTRAARIAFSSASSRSLSSMSTKPDSHVLRSR